MRREQPPAPEIEDLPMIDLFRGAHRAQQRGDRAEHYRLMAEIRRRSRWKRLRAVHAEPPRTR